MPLRLACAALCMFLSACCCGIPLPTTSTTRPTTPPAQQRQEPVRPYLQVPDKPDEPITVATDQKTHDELAKYSLAGDKVGIERMFKQGRAFNVPSGARVRILDRGFFTTEIRILEYSHKDEVAIVDSEFIVK
jgi:hypothetical protein